jgi:hypothetical protein
MRAALCRGALAAWLAMSLAAGWAQAHPSSPADRDHDNVQNQNDNCPDAYNPKQEDVDRDWVSNGGLPATGTPADPATNTGGDACDIDDDGDAVNDELDNCPKVDNRNQADVDADGDGDACDLDDDGDGILDDKDNCPKVPNHGQGDADDDFIGDACDPDAKRSPPRPGGGSSPAPAPGGTPVTGGGAPDTRPPALTVGLRSLPRLAALQAGIIVPVTCSESCTLQSELAVDRRTARRLRLAATPHGATIARGTAGLGEAGRTFVFLRFTRGALARLARGGAVRPVLRVLAQDTSGNRAEVSRRLTIRP